MPENIDIVWTIVDEAPRIASASLLPIVQAVTQHIGINVVKKDISLTSRILSQFPEVLTADQQRSDDLAWLGEWVNDPKANIIKLPNISASIAQMKAAIKELQEKGYALPDYPEQADSDTTRSVRARYDAIKGSAVNPVLRRGNSDRRVAGAVKAYAQQFPHQLKPWHPQSKTSVAHMTEGDFYESETSLTIEERHAGRAHIEFVAHKQAAIKLKTDLTLAEGDVIDSAMMSIDALHKFINNSIQRAKQSEILLSLHLKATMMKVSDPVIFGHVVKCYFQTVFTKFAAQLADIDANPNHGFADILHKISQLPENEQTPLRAAIDETLANSAALAMVNSDKGITNLHVPSDVIIDASMAAAIKNGGKMWDSNGDEQDTLAMIPDRCYAGIYQAALDFCRNNGAFDPATMGSVANVGLMADKAEEYGSHDKTFIAPEAGVMRVVSAAGVVLLEQDVKEGDLFRCCITRKQAIDTWVALAVERARISNTPVVFWLDEARAHDREISHHATAQLNDLNTHGLNIEFMSPAEAMTHTMQRCSKGENTIAATGNVLRDYLTDLFPILELGTSAKMLSIVPLANGGGLFETGAGGSAPKHVEQFMQEGHLRWDSLGEFLALSESLAHLSRRRDHRQADILATTLNAAIKTLLNEAQSPGRKVGSISNNESHYHLTRHWVAELAKQNDDAELSAHFKTVSAALEKQHATICQELTQSNGQSKDCGGYYDMSEQALASAVASSKTFNDILSMIV